jgi:quercetin dioxygenase-like cupin family protein
VARQGDTIGNPVTGERITFLETSRDTGGKLLRLDWSLAPDGFLPGAHTHPHQEERFEVLSGTLGLRVGRRKYRLGAGEAVVVPPGAVHAWWIDGDEVMRGQLEFRPALDMESVFETSFGLARDGKVSKKGVPGPLQIIALLDEYEDELGIPWVPKRLQHAVMSLLAPLARRRGYRGRYQEYGDQQLLLHPRAKKDSCQSVLTARLGNVRKTIFR